MIPLLSNRFCPDSVVGEALYCIGRLNAVGLERLLATCDVLDCRPGCAFDLTDCPPLDDVLPLVGSLRDEVFNWVCCGRGQPRAQNPIVLLCRDAASCSEVEDWAARRFWCPAIWFALGVHILDVNSILKFEAKYEDMDEGFGVALSETLWNAIAAALEGLRHSPLVGMGHRAAALFCGREQSDRPNCLDGRLHALIEIPPPAQRHEIMVLRPSTYQLEGGLTVPLPTSVLEKTTAHIVSCMSPPKDLGWTEVQGTGRWFNERFGQVIREEVTRIEIVAKVHQAALRFLSGYLRFSWLQDLVIVTYDGRSLDEVLAELDRR